MRKVYEVLSDFLVLAKKMFCFEFEDIKIQYQETVHDTAYGKCEVYRVVRRIGK